MLRKPKLRVSTPRSPVFSFSQQSTAAHCERKWAFKYVDMLPDVPTKAMSLGKAYHRMWGAHLMGEDWKKEGRVIGEEILDTQPELATWPEWLETAVWLMGRWIEHYPNDADEWETLGVEVPFEIRLPAKNGWLVGYFDAIRRHRPTGEEFLWECKTMSDWDYLDTLIWDSQCSLYIYAAQQVGADISSLVLDAARTYRWVKPRPVEESFDRRFVDRNQEHLEFAIDEAKAVLDRTRVILRGARPIRNLGRHCSWCQYRNPCVAELAFGPEPQFAVEEEDES